VLATCENDNSTVPSRYQLHRAPTAIDHKGYLSSWAATGLDKEMHHVSRNESELSHPEVGADVLHRSNLRLTQVERIYLHDNPVPGVGITCRWETASDAIDR
jgi:hypothetical protein